MTEAPRTLVVGAGAAGISAAAWLRELEMPFDWIARSNRATTLDRVGNPIGTLPPVPPMAGAALADQLRQWCETQALFPRMGVVAEGFAPEPGALRVTLTGPEPSERVTKAYAAVVLATGTTPRLLGLAGEQALLHRGVELSVTRTRAAYAGRPCVVVGGGDAALEGALLLTEVTNNVTLVHRREQFRGQRRFIDAVRNHPSIRVVQPSHVVRLDLVGEQLAAVVLANGERIPAAGLFVRIGVQAAIPESLPQTVRDAQGYLAVDPDGRTPMSRLYAAGDVCSPNHQSVAWSIGQAARTIATLREDLGF